MRRIARGVKIRASQTPEVEKLSGVGFEPAVVLQCSKIFIFFMSTFLLHYLTEGKLVKLKIEKREHLEGKLVFRPLVTGR